MPRVCVFGAGAIGGLLAARLEHAGIAVSVVARGAHRDAILAAGLALDSGGRRIVAHPRVVADAAELGPQDYLILTVKAHSLRPALPQLLPLIDPATTIVAAINGIPWWYCHGLEAPWRDRIVTSVDPEAALWHALPPAQTVGAIVYPAAEIVGPGVVAHTYGDRFSLGEPDGTSSARVQALAHMLTAAGFKAPVRPRIRDEMWVKLWGNMAFNPLSALTTARLDVLLADADTRAVCRAMMLEGQGVALGLGVRLAIGVDRRLQGADEVGAHKTSMLQDLELGRPLEIDALLGAVVEMADWVSAPVPLSRAVLALVRQRAGLR